MPNSAPPKMKANAIKLTARELMDHLPQRYGGSFRLNSYAYGKPTNQDLGKLRKYNSPSHLQFEGRRTDAQTLGASSRPNWKTICRFYRGPSSIIDCHDCFVSNRQIFVMCALIHQPTQQFTTEDVKLNLSLRTAQVLRSSRDALARFIQDPSAVQVVVAPS